MDRLRFYLGNTPFYIILGKFVSITFLFFFSINTNAQVETNFSSGGGVIVGDSTSACPGAPSIEGAIRYDADGADTLDYCTGSGWVTMLTSSIGDAIVNNGNSFGVPMVIGTNDTQTLSFETDGTTRMTIDTSGSVGVGTTTPSAMLHLNGGTGSLASGLVFGDGDTGIFENTDDNLFIWGPGTVSIATGAVDTGNDRIDFDTLGNYGTIRDRKSGLKLQNENQQSEIKIDWTDHISLSTNSNERMRIDSSGNVGIGTTAPATILDINGAESMRGMAAPAVSPAGQGRIYFDSTANKYRVSENTGAYFDLVGGSGDFLADGSVPMTGAFLAANGSAGAPSITFANDTNSGFYLSGGNSIGITVNGVNHGSMSNGEWTIYRKIRTANCGVTEPCFSFTGDIDTGMFSSGTNELGFSTAGIERLIVDAAGNVGVGTTSPAALLHVDSNADSEQGVFVRNQSSGTAAATGVTVGNDSGNTGQLGVYSTGYTSSGLREQNKVALLAGAPTDGLNLFTVGADPLILGTASQDRLHIDASGNVGIGTTAPDTVLDINGAESMRGMAAPAASPAGQGRIYFDSTSNTYKVSENNGAYVDLVGGGGGSGDILNGGNTEGSNITIGTNDAFSMFFETSGTIRGGVSNTGIFTNSGYGFRIGGLSNTSSFGYSVIPNTVTAAPAEPTLSSPDRYVWGIDRNGATGGGEGLYLTAGAPDPGQTNYQGGNLILGSGMSTGNNTSHIKFMTPTPGASGSADNTPDEKMRITGDGNVGIGTTAPWGKLTVWDNDADSEVTIMNEDSSVARYPGVRVLNYMGTPNAGHPHINLVNSRGSDSSPAAVVAGDVLGSIDFTGMYNTSWNQSIGAMFQGEADENWSATNRGTRLTFDTTSNGTTSPTERMRIDHNGNVGIGSTNPAQELDVVGDIQYTGVLIDASDRRLKKDIEPMSNALRTIAAIEGVSFKMIDDPEEKTEFGVIAQQVEEIIPELVFTKDDEQKTKAVNYQGFIAWIIEAVKELAFGVEDNRSINSDQSQEITKLKSKLEQKDKRIDDLERRLLKIEERLDDQK